MSLPKADGLRYTTVRFTCVIDLLLVNDPIRWGRAKELEAAQEIYA